jgi:hypothetical protein
MCKYLFAELIIGADDNSGLAVGSIPIKDDSTKLLNGGGAELMRRLSADPAMEEQITFAVGYGALLLRYAIDNPNTKYSLEINKVFPDFKKTVEEASAKGAIRALNNRPSKVVGRPPQYTKRKMDQACDRIHELINKAGMKQIPAATKVIITMKMNIGARYMIEQYRAWFLIRQQRKTT